MCAKLLCNVSARITSQPAIPDNDRGLLHAIGSSDTILTQESTHIFVCVCVCLKNLLLPVFLKSATIIVCEDDTKLWVGNFLCGCQERAAQFGTNYRGNKSSVH